MIKVWEEFWLQYGPVFKQMDISEADARMFYELSPHAKEVNGLDNFGTAAHVSLRKVRMQEEKARAKTVSILTKKAAKNTTKKERLSKPQVQAKWKSHPLWARIVAVSLTVFFGVLAFAFVILSIAFLINALF